MKNLKITIVDYGVGNTFSICNAIKYLGYKDIFISSKESEILKSDVLILPGVGAFEACKKNLTSRNLIPTLNYLVLENKIPILGVCVGMQLMATSSEENGIHLGLNWIPGKVKKFILPNEFHVPHVGWNNIDIKINNPILNQNKEESNFYFDHSYYYECENKFITSTCNYGINVTSSIQFENIFGVQFHPEKSQINGLKLFRNFLNFASKC